MRKFLSFTEVCGNATIDFFASPILDKMQFPITGGLAFGQKGNNPYTHKGVYHSSDKSLLDLETTVSWIMSQKNKSWDENFYVAKTIGIQIIIEVQAKSENEDISMVIHELSENSLPSDTPLTPLEIVKNSKPEIIFNLLEIEDYPDEPAGDYDVYMFNKQALQGTLHVSPDKKIMFHGLQDGGFERIWSKSLPPSINRFLSHRSRKGVLSQTVVANKMVYLLENGMVYNGTGNLKKQNVSRESYEYLVYLAELHYRGENIHIELTPCLFCY